MSHDFDISSRTSRLARSLQVPVLLLLHSTSLSTVDHATPCKDSLAATPPLTPSCCSRSPSAFCDSGQRHCDCRTSQLHCCHYSLHHCFRQHPSCCHACCSSRPTGSCPARLPHPSIPEQGHRGGPLSGAARRVERCRSGIVGSDGGR